MNNILWPKNISSNQLFSTLHIKTVTYFHEIFAKNAWERIPVISTVLEWKIYFHWKNISLNHLFSDFISKTVAFTNFLPKMRECEFLKLPHCVLVLPFRFYVKSIFLNKEHQKLAFFFRFCIWIGFKWKWW